MLFKVLVAVVAAYHIMKFGFLFLKFFLIPFITETYIPFFQSLVQ